MLDESVPVAATSAAADTAAELILRTEQSSILENAIKNSSSVLSNMAKTVSRFLGTTKGVGTTKYLLSYQQRIIDEFKQGQLYILSGSILGGNKVCTKTKDNRYYVYQEYAPISGCDSATCTISISPIIDKYRGIVETNPGVGLDKFTEISDTPSYCIKRISTIKQLKVKQWDILLFNSKTRLARVSILKDQAIRNIYYPPKMGGKTKRNQTKSRRAKSRRANQKTKRVMSAGSKKNRTRRKRTHKM